MKNHLKLAETTVKYLPHHKPKIGFLSNSVGVFNEEGKKKVESQMRSLYEKLSVEEVISQDSLFYFRRIFGPIEAKQAAAKFCSSKIDALVLLNSAFPNGNVFLALATDPYLSQIPFILTAAPEIKLPGNEWTTNAFCGVIMNNYVAKKLKVRPFVLCGWPNDEKYIEDFKHLISVICTVKKLRNTLLGRFGDAPSGFHSATGDQIAYAKKFGVIIETLDLSSIFQSYNTCEVEGYKGRVIFTDEEVEQTYLEMKKGRKVTVDAENVKKAAKLYQTLRIIIEANGYTAISIRCWPELMGPPLNMAACLSVSWLQEKGIISGAACEGDWPTAVTQVIGTMLSEKPAVCLDFVNHIAKPIVQLGHCGVGIPSLMENCQIAENSPSYQAGSSISPTCIGQFCYGLKTGIGLMQDQKGRFKMLVFRGESDSDTAQNIRYCAADIKVKNYQKLQDIIISHGFSHHLAVVFGDITQQLKLLCNFYDIEYLNPDDD